MNHINVGGIIGNGLTKHTNYLIIGDIDLKKLNGGTKTNEMMKAEKYIQEGLDIQIISENDFLRMI